MRRSCALSTGCSSRCDRTRNGRRSTKRGSSRTSAWRACSPSRRTRDDMGADPIDATFETWHDARDAIRRELYSLQDDPDRELLDAVDLAGVTALRWAEAGAILRRLWQECAATDDGAEPSYTTDDYTRLAL